MATLMSRPVQVWTQSPDRNGMLLLADEQIVALLVQLGDLHGQLEGRWFAEYLSFPAAHPPIFETLDAAIDWIRGKIAGLDKRIAPAGPTRLALAGYDI